MYYQLPLAPPLSLLPPLKLLMLSEEEEEEELLSEENEDELSNELNDELSLLSLKSLLDESPPDGQRVTLKPVILKKEKIPFPV